MTMHVHHLRGCAPAPLAHYLKAIGILRLVAEQADSSARLWWQDEHACLATTLDETALLAFFSETYRPTPMIAPWNGGSGFYQGDNIKGISAIGSSSGERFSEFRAAITFARGQVIGREESPKEEAKKDLIAECRRHWRGGVGRWLAAAIVIDADLVPKYPALLGTGGNDGRLDFTNNFHQRLIEVIATEDPTAPGTVDGRRWARAALFGGAVPGLLAGKAIGQFLPGAAGGANSSTGFDADSLVNPWDFILMLEGCVLWSAALCRRLGTEGVSMISSPFSMRGQAAGHGTACTGEDSPRGEQWMPLWLRPVGCDEAIALLQEGRLTTASGPAQRPVDAARAIARLGVARGITAFQRFGYLERNGQANLAIPLGRWQVQPNAHADVIDHAATWIDRLGRVTRGDGVPAAWMTAARRCDEALLACCRSSDARHRLELFLSLGAAETALSRTPSNARDAGLRPLSRLPGAWLAALPTSPELRLAVAISTQDGGGLSLRRHWLANDNRDFAKKSDVEVVVTRDSMIADAIAIVRRRGHSAGPFGFVAHRVHAAGLADLAAFMRGTIDDGLLWSLVRPLLALDWDAVPGLPAPVARTDDLGVLAVAGVLRLAHHATPLPGCDKALAVDPTILARLLAGDPPGAIRLAARRLTNVGLRPYLTATVSDRAAAQRLAASLLIPLHSTAIDRLVARLTRPSPDVLSITH